MEDTTRREIEETAAAAEPAENETEPTAAVLDVSEGKADDSEALVEYDDDEDDEEDDEETDEDGETLPAEPEDDTPHWCDKVFGMYRLSFYGICFGYGGGLVAAGLFSMLTGIEIARSSIPGIAGAVIGYFIGHRITKRMLAKAEAEKQL